MTKLLFLGLDALDRLIIQELIDYLPNISHLQKQAVSLPVKSTFPPDSDTAWASIVTGLNPAEHGVVHFVDPLEKVHHLQNVGTDSAAVRGKTFWDILGKNGYKAHAIFPHICYPVWDIPGVLVARGFITMNGVKQSGIQSNRPELLDIYPRPDTVLGMKGFPKPGLKGLEAYADNLIAITEADAQFALDLMKNLDWDLFFFYLPTIDGACHFFWNFYKPAEPNFNRNHPLHNVIPSIYKLHDDIIGRFMNSVNDDVIVIVMSDHGHGGRPYIMVNINEILRQEGLLKAQDINNKPHIYTYEKLKRAGVRAVSRLGLGQLASNALKHFPNIKESLTHPSSIIWDETIAYASDMSGIKAYTYGGVNINKLALDNLDYEQTRIKIITLLEKRCILPDGERLLKFIGRREDLYSGPHIAKYPDIVLEFKYGYGVGWPINVPLITTSESHNLVPGSHRGETGTFFLKGPFNTTRAEIDLLDITPTVLDIFKINYSKTLYTGASLLQN